MARKEGRISPATARRVRSLQLRWVAVAITVAGGILMYLASDHIEPTAYSLSENGSITPTQGTYWPAWDWLRDLGITLFGVGAVGVVYQALNVRAQEEVTQTLFEESSPAIGSSVAALVVGDKRFIDEVLTDEQRAEFLTKIIMGHLDESAESVASNAADQLSGNPVLWNYTATYTPKDRQNGKKSTDPHAILEQSLVTNQQPNETFEYRFQVFTDEDTDKFGYGPEVFMWRYWLAPHERADPQKVLDQFKVIEVSVNGAALDVPKEPTEKTNDSVIWHATYEPTPSENYLVETVLRLPPSHEASYVHLEPRALCRSVNLRCNVTDSEFDAVAVETLRAPNIRIKKERDWDAISNRNRVTRTVVRTTGWVLPTASVAFVFYTPTKPYNRDGNADAVAGTTNTTGAGGHTESEEPSANAT